MSEQICPRLKLYFVINFFSVTLTVINSFICNVAVKRTLVAMTAKSFISPTAVKFEIDTETDNFTTYLIHSKQSKRVRH